jgi:ABC-type transport system substrate-binding protein
MCVAAISGTPQANNHVAYTGTNYNTPVTPTPPKVGPGQYGPTNSSQLVDESGGTAPDALDPAYAFYAQDTYFINALYNDMVEYTGTNGSSVVPVLASSVDMTNGGCTTVFHLRTGVTFSNGDPFNAFAQWFSIVRTQVENGPSGISISNWNLVSYNETTGCPFGTGCYEYSQGDQIPWGVRGAIQSVTGMQTAANTPAAVSLSVSVIQQMLSHFNPSNATQAAIMAYPNQAYVATNATTFIANYLRTLGPLALQWWAGFSGQQPVDPAYVDAHGGVTFNTLNSYYDSNGGPGTGPYMIKSVGTAMNPIVMVANPNYWAASATGVPQIARPASINTIIYNYYSTDAQAEGDFGSNKAQLSAESAINFQAMYGGLPSNVRHHFKFNHILQGVGYFDFALWGSMNQNIYPTNNTNFRRGLANAINYTAINHVNLFNGTYYANNFAGPLTPGISPYYNPLGYPLPSQNTAKAWNYFQKFGMQTHTYMVIPSDFTLSNGTMVKHGTILGDKTGQQMPPMKLYYTVPLTGATQIVLTILQQNLATFGIPAVPYGTTSAEFDILDGNPKTYPVFQLIGWGADFNQPFYAQLYPTIGYPSAYNGWFQNATVLAEATKCLFPPTQNATTACINTLYAYTAQNQLFVYQPVTLLNLFFIQPYLQGVTDNQFKGVFYNQFYYSPVSVS